MSDRLELELAVYNAAHYLDEQVHRLLDMLPDYSQHFCLWIVDHGSEDDTQDIAYELARRYPQVRVRRAANGRRNVGGEPRITIHAAEVPARRLQQALDYLLRSHGTPSCDLGSQGDAGYSDTISPQDKRETVVHYPSLRAECVEPPALRRRRRSVTQ